MKKLIAITFSLLMSFNILADEPIDSSFDSLLRAIEYKKLCEKTSNKDICKTAKEFKDIHMQNVINKKHDDVYKIIREMQKDEKQGKAMLFYALETSLSL